MHSILGTVLKDHPEVLTGPRCSFGYFVHAVLDAHVTPLLAPSFLLDALQGAGFHF